MGVMRRFLILALAAAVACKSNPAITTKVHPISLELPEQLERQPSTQLVRRAARNTTIWQDLITQGRPDQATALAIAIGRTVDENFEVFVEVARNGVLKTLRNEAVKCLAFSREHRLEATTVLMGMLDDPTPAIVANAVRGIGLLKDSRTELAPLIHLLAHGSPTVRTESARALKELFMGREPMLVLTPQQRVALDRLGAMSTDRTNTAGRRAAVWALAYMRNPETLYFLISSLEDTDVRVQVGGLLGIERLADPRAIAPLIEYLNRNPTEAGSSWARRALIKIAVAEGRAASEAELATMGTGVAEWQDLFRAKPQPAPKTG